MDLSLPRETLGQPAIYLDGHSTTPVAAEVMAEMLPCFAVDFGNPGSESHGFGHRAKARVDEARQTLAAQIGCQCDELVFTSGATEANNLAIFGAAARWQGKRNRLVTVGIEHPSILEPLKQLERAGWEVTRVPVHPQTQTNAAPEMASGGEAEPRWPGRVDLAALREAVDQRTALVSIAAANHEIGVIQPTAEIAQIAHSAGAWFHADASQAVGWLPLDVRHWQADMISYSGHKCYGPKGVGALYVRRRPLNDAPRPIRLVPQTVGGGQEFGLRAGTLNSPGIVGMAAAVRLANQNRMANTERVLALRNRLWSALLGRNPDLQLNGPDWRFGAPRLPHNLNFAVPGVEGQSVMLHTTGLAMSSGSACSSANPGVSAVLLALGIPDDQARCSLRLGLSYTLSSEMIDSAAEQLSQGIRSARAG
jgi:cysteine desulfurase